MASNKGKQARLARCEKCGTASSVLARQEKVIKILGDGCPCSEPEMAFLEAPEIFNE